MKKRNRILALLLSATMLLGMAPVSTAWGAAEEPEIVAGGYEIDMDDLPKVYFSEHPEWQALYEEAWHTHKNNIKKASTSINPNDVYFVDEAFNEEIYAWDTMFMMMFDKYGYNQFPTLNSLDNFYYSQYESEMYEVAEVVGAFWAGSINNSYYDNTRKHHNNGVGQKPENDTTGLSDTEMKEQAFVDQLNENRQGNTAYVEWKPDEGQENNGYPVFAAEPYSEPEALSFAGDGSEENPYRITSVADLEELARRVNSGEEDTEGKFYLLTNDLVLTGENNHTPVGSEENKFRGTFDGGFHTVTGMRIDTDEMTQGLFGFVEGGTVKNVGVVDAEIYCEQNSGVIAGQAKVNASILNCFVRDSKLKCVDFLTNGMANKNNNVAGGVVGMLESGSVVGNCYSVNCSVEGRNYVGGLVGLVREGSPVVDNCYSSSDVLFNGDGYIFRKRYENNGTTYYDYADVTGLNPPLWAWAEWEQYKVHGDKSRFTTVIQGPGQQPKTIFERLVAHYEFIDREKKVASGLYGKTSGDANGFDDTPNQDWPWVTATAGKGEQTYNDLSIQEAQFAYYLALIAEEIGETEQAEHFRQEFERLSGLINEKLWSDELGFYFNLAPDGVTQTNVATPTGLWALAAHVATPERAESLVEDYALNSEKMFRPNGLSTASYDDPAFRPKGKYWNGSVWAPASYQYIKGLSEYGYSDVAFEESIRHVNNLCRVYEKGYNGQHTFWECYSPDYTRPATTKQDDGNSRPNFVGWTGCLAIGIVIEDILGVTLDGPHDTINWDIHLTEANGIENLWMRDNDLNVNRVSLHAAERTNASSAVEITVEAERPLTLNVRNGGEFHALEVPAGQSSFVIPGTGDADEEPYMMMADAEQLTGVEEALTKEALDQNALDYVVFSVEEDASITDGIQNRVSKNGLLYNINSIGYRSNLTVQDDAFMQSLGFDGAQALVKESNADGEEGFMMMAPADNGLRTMKVLVGVKNATATLTAWISDASQPSVSQQIAAGDAEKTYLLEIPYRAAGDGRNLYVEYRINTNSSDAQISLKGIVLEEGGRMIPKPPASIQVEGGDGSLTVDVPDEVYEQYVIYLGTSEGDWSQSYVVDALPYTVDGLENYQRYYVAVSTIQNGEESNKSQVSSVVPEPAGTTDEDRARADIQAALPELLNGNPDFEHISGALNFQVTGPIYGSALAVTSSTADGRLGIMADGSVNRPVYPMEDREATLTIQAVYNDAQVQVDQPATVLASNPETDAYVSGSSYPIRATLNLTEEGTKDWVQFCSKEDTEYARKNIAEPFITNFVHLDDGYTEVTGDAPFIYVYEESDVAEGLKPQNVGAIVSKFIGNGFTFDLPYSENMQKVKVYAGCYKAKGIVELLINGQVMFRDNVTVNQNTLDINSFRAFDINFKAASPDDKITIRFTTGESYTTSGNGGSIILAAATLQDIDESIWQNVQAEGETQIEAEDYTQKSAAANVEDCGEGGQNVGSLNAGEWLLYQIQVEQSAPYQLSFRMAAMNEVDPQMEILVDDEPVALFSQPVQTGAWQTWDTFVMEEPVFLEEGAHTLEFRYQNSGTNLNWFTLNPLAVEDHLLTVQWSGNASMSVEGNAEAIISTDAIYGAKVQPGEELVFTFTPTKDGFSGAQLNGEDIEFAADGCTYTFTMPGESTTLRFTFTSVDKSILGAVLEQANAVPQDVIDGLVPQAKEFFENALENAQTVYDNANATQEEVNEAWSDLLDAMHLLEFEAGDKEVLLPLINIAEQLAERLDEFKPGTTEGFEEALNAAKDVYAEENPLKADVDEAYDNLQAAIEKLEFRADMSELQSLVDEANTLDPDDYIQDEAFDTFKSVLAEAEELLANANADQADVDAKAEALTRAMAALRKIPNKDELNKLIAEMEQKDLDGYTDRSVAAFKAALSVAKTVAADANADEQAVAKAYTNLEAAANNLVKAEKPGTGNSGKGSTSANVGNAYGAAGVVSAAQGVASQKAYVVSDTTVNFTLKRGSAYCFKMTVVNGNNMVPGFTAGNGEVLKTQFVAKIGNDYYYRVYATGTPGQSTGVYTTLPGQNAVKHCAVTIG